MVCFPMITPRGRDINLMVDFYAIVISDNIYADDLKQFGFTRFLI